MSTAFSTAAGRSSGARAGVCVAAALAALAWSGAATADPSARHATKHAAPASVDETASGLHVGLAAQLDWATASGPDVCRPASQIAEDFTCYRENGSPYYGTPKKGYEDAVSGFQAGTTRFLLRADYFVSTALSLGGRAGVAVGGAPRSSGGDAPRFLPVHLEARATLWGDTNGLGLQRGLGWELFMASGMAQYDTGYPVDVAEDRSKAPPVYQLDNPRRQTLTAYKKVGRGFAGGGAGLVYRADPVAVSLEVALSYGFPSSGLVVSPGLALTFGL